MARGTWQSLSKTSPTGALAAADGDPAQEASRDEVIEEILVTARKRSEVASLVADAVKVFESLGCEVEALDPDLGDPREMELFFYAANFAGNLAPVLDEWEHRMDPGLVACARDGLHYSAVEYVQMVGRRIAYYDKVRSFIDDFDLLLTPTQSVAAFPAGRLIPEHWEQHPWDWIRWAGFFYPFNLTGYPAATCPCGFTPDGLPVGLQIAGGRFQDARVLQASRAFEQARPWADTRAPMT